MSLDRVLSIRLCKLAIRVAAYLIFANAIPVADSVAAPDTAPANGSTAQFARIGERLFQDRRFSADGQVSCTSCHIQSLCFADARPTAIGLRGQLGTRNTPSLYNVGLLRTLFWDGRAHSLEEQAPLPLTNQREHGLSNESAVLDVLKRDAEYSHELSVALAVPVSALQLMHVSAALAAFQRTLVGLDSAFDRYISRGDKAALSSRAIRGMQLFTGRAGCIACHTMQETPPLFTDQKFHASPLKLSQETSAALGELAARIEQLVAQKREAELNQLIAQDPSVASLGRFLATLNPQDIGKFRTPSLRNVARTGPYMHDGSVQSLSVSIDLELYSRGNVNYPIILTAEEKKELMEFLEALTSTKCSNT